MVLHRPVEPARLIGTWQRNRALNWPILRSPLRVLERYCLRAARSVRCAGEWFESRNSVTSLGQPRPSQCKSQRARQATSGGFMRTIIINGLALTLVTVIALAKQPAPKPVAQPAPQSSEKPTNLFMSASQVNDLIEKAKSERKPNQNNVLEPILELGGYDGHLEYRASVGNAAQHETEAELFYVIDG